MSTGADQPAVFAAGPFSAGPLVLEPLFRPNLIIFDWHGTLVDTLDAVYASMQEVLLQLKSLDLLKNLVDEAETRTDAEARLVRYIRIYRKLHPTILAEKKHSRTELFNIIFGDNEQAKSVAHTAYNEQYRQNYGQVRPFQPGIEDYLANFAEAGIQLAVATNRSREFLEAEFRSLGDWGRFFAFTVCADEVDSYKPRPEILLEAMQKARRVSGGPVRAWYFGDSPTDMLTAWRARQQLEKNGAEDQIRGIYFNAAHWDTSWIDALLAEAPEQREPSLLPAAACASLGQLRTLLARCFLEEDEVDELASARLIDPAFPVYEPRHPPPARIEPDWHPAVARLSEPRVILFDWHATLVDTLDAMYHAVDDMLLQLDTLGLTSHLMSPSQSRTLEDARLVEHVKHYRQLHPKVRADRKISRTDIFEVLFGDDQDAKNRAHAAFTHHYRAHFGTVLPFEPGIRPMLEGLRDLGIVTGIITNRDREFFEQELAIVEDGTWVSLFDTDICGDDTQLRKPQPHQILKALDNLKRAPGRDVWYVGDSTTDIRAAAKAGVTGVFFNGAQWDQSWLIRIFPGSEQFPDKPDVVVNDFSEFWALVLACQAKIREGGRQRRR
ncbi:HAD family hydrolase [Allohahella marinimesophila]|uniref:Phosphoglycolate phosphatase n=1 Tax=Allohahella marinimesophila TaxID=1054972 RepID=A0ABP7Q5I1_9GAMM